MTYATWKGRFPTWGELFLMEDVIQWINSTPFTSWWMDFFTSQRWRCRVKQSDSGGKYNTPIFASLFSQNDLHSSHLRSNKYNEDNAHKPLHQALFSAFGIDTSSGPRKQCPGWHFRVGLLAGWMEIRIHVSNKWYSNNFWEAVTLLWLKFYLGLLEMKHM
jgi:hypothetical protein